MAVDSKYANLPGIDTQPDVYETSDLPEEDQPFEPDELSSESVERLKVNTAEAFNKFKDAKVLTANSDFSDSVSKSRKTGYVVPRTEYEILEDGSSKETPVQKYQRLQHEIKQLGEEVQEIQKTVKDEKTLAQVSPAGLFDQVTGLQEGLFQLHLEQILGSDALVELSDPKGAVPKKLFSQLDTYKKQGMGQSKEDSSKSKAAPAAAGDRVTYEVFHYPNRDQFDQVSKTAELEARLARLEALLGGNPEKISYVTADTTSKTLMESVDSLQSQVSVLDVNMLDHAEARMQNLLQKMDQAREKSDRPEEVDAQISELYALVTKWACVADSLPKIHERLKALKELHEQALQFSQALTQLDTAQQQVTTGLQNQSTLQKQLAESFTTNLAAIEANCKSLEERFKKIPKK